MHKKAFVSHASEDKERFVLEFASKLRANGVDAWLDRWEMLPGDSLVGKIFEEGLKNANPIIVVLSNYSVRKPWVTEEINAAFVKRVQNQTKLIPVLIDDCEVPQCLISTLWERIDPATDYSAGLSRIVNSICGRTDKPLLGVPPETKRTAFESIPLSYCDKLVLEVICEAVVACDSENIDKDHVFSRANSAGITDDEVVDSFEILRDNGLIRLVQTTGESRRDRIAIIGKKNQSFKMYLQSKRSDYHELERMIACSIVNSPEITNREIAVASNVPHVIIDHFYYTLTDEGLIKTHLVSGGTFVVAYVSPALRRQLQ